MTELTAATAIATPEDGDILPIRKAGAAGLLKITLAQIKAYLKLGTAAALNTGTSGATIPRLDTANTWGAANTFGALSSTSFATTTTGSGNLLSVAAEGAGADNSNSTIGVTRGTAGNFSYYGMTRAGNVVWGIGLSTGNNFLIGSAGGGSIGTVAIQISYGAGGAQRQLSPGSDNAYNLGAAALRWLTIYAGTGGVISSGPITSTGKVTAASLNLSNIPTYASDSAAGSGGLASGDVYKVSDGASGFNLKIKA